jgi:predicted TIM-barrel fold metal-dependent hydrolase
MSQFGAMAEVLLWHARKEKAPTVILGSWEKTGKPPQVVVWPDDPRVQVALDITLEKKWPFVAHIEFATIGVDRALFMDKFEQLLRKNIDHPIVLMHMGELNAKEVRRLIEGHENIYFNTAMSNPIVVSRSAQPLVNLFIGKTLAPDWRNLFILYSDRFILGFDNVFSHHCRKLYVKQVKLWKQALKDLPERVAHAVAHRNSESLWGLMPLK